MISEEEFYENLEKDNSEEDSKIQKEYLENVAFDRIFLEAEKGSMYWRRLENKLIKSKVLTQNYSGKLVEIPVFLAGDMTPGTNDLSLSLFEPRKSYYIGGVDKRMERFLRKVAYNIFSGTKPEFIEE